MSAAFQQRMVALRAARIRKGENVGEQPRVGARMVDFSALGSCIGRGDDGQPVDLGAKYLGVAGSTVMKADAALPPSMLIDTGITRPTPEPVRKRDAFRPVEYVSGAIAMDGMHARERIAKADATGFPADRDDAHETKAKPPAPPEGEHVSYSDLMSRINASIAAAIPGLVAAVASSLRIPANATTGNPPASVAKSERITIRKFEHRERGTPGMFNVSAPNLGARLFGVQ